MIRTPNGNVRENVLPAGAITFHGEKERTISIDSGADEIMKVLDEAGEIRDIDGEQSTNVGNMLNRTKSSMADVSQAEGRDIRITDILAVDTLAPVEISGALAGETCMEKAAGIVSHGKNTASADAADRTEAGRRTPCPGCGGRRGSCDGFSWSHDYAGNTTSAGDPGHGRRFYGCGGSGAGRKRKPTTHQAGAGELVTMLIQTELGLKSRAEAEQIKRYPLWEKSKVFFTCGWKMGAMQFFEDSIESEVLWTCGTACTGRNASGGGRYPHGADPGSTTGSQEEGFCTQCDPCVKTVAPERNPRNIPNVVLVGGSAEDFEIPEMLMQALSEYRIVCGRGNIRGTEGPEMQWQPDCLCPIWDSDKEYIFLRKSVLKSCRETTILKNGCSASTGKGENDGSKQAIDHHIYGSCGPGFSPGGMRRDRRRRCSVPGDRKGWRS